VLRRTSAPGRCCNILLAFDRFLQRGDGVAAFFDGPFEQAFV
jgi:hypothetical protein